MKRKMMRRKSDGWLMTVVPQQLKTGKWDEVEIDFPDKPTSNEPVASAKAPAPKTEVKAKPKAKAKPKTRSSAKPRAQAAPIDVDDIGELLKDLGDANS